MKQSKYNYIYHTESGSYWMNGITRAVLKFSNSLGKKIHNMLNDPETIKLGSQKLYELLTTGGFIIPQETDEIQVIRKSYTDYVNAKNYFLIIMPTLDCNFKCPYCVQAHIPSQMNDATIDKIKRHIQFMIEKEGIRSLTLEWFGGEPFLYFDEVVKPITLFAKEQCSNANVPFYAGATSNASLISGEVSSHFKELSFNHFQITLDGDRSLHDSIKFGKNIFSAFDTTLTNISTLVHNNPSATISLRINYTDETLNSNIVSEVSERLDKGIRSNIIINLKKVWQHSVDKSRFDRCLKILNDFKEQGFKVIWLDIIDNMMPCYVNKKYYACINHDGSVVKCTNCDDIYSDNAPGHINEDGSIGWKDNFDIINQEPAFENPNCLQCNRLPLCMGHCPRNHMRLSAWSCKWNAFDIDLQKAVIAHIDNFYEP